MQVAPQFKIPSLRHSSVFSTTPCRPPLLTSYLPAPPAALRPPKKPLLLSQHVPPFSANMPSSPSLPPFRSPSLLYFSHAASFCHHIVGVVSLHVPLYSANKLPCGPPAPPPSCLPTFMFYPPPSSRLSFLTLSHHYVSGNTSLFCIRLFSPLWQAGQHANMQNGDREAFCNVVRKERRRNCRQSVCLCVFQQFLTIRAMVATGARATREPKVTWLRWRLEYHHNYSYTEGYSCRQRSLFYSWDIARDFFFHRASLL